KQPDPKADAFVNKFKFPKPGEVIFVGGLTEPADPVRIAETTLDIKEIITYHGRATWERKLVVSPTAKPGAATVSVPVTILACDKSCFTRPLTTNAELTISDAPPVPVDPQFAAEVTGGPAPPPAN